MFTHYVADRFGAGVMSDTIHDRAAGINAVNDALGNRGITETFADVFTDWMVASYLNDATVGSQYAYARPGLSQVRVSAQTMAYMNGPGSANSNITVKDWQPSWYGYTLSSAARGYLTIQISGQSGERWSGAAVSTYADGHHKVQALDATGQAIVPVSDGSSSLSNVMVAFTVGTVAAVGDSVINSHTATLSVTLADAPLAPVQPTPVATGAIQDGDLIQRAGQAEVYVIWGKYRRYMTPGTLRLYGFDTRPVKPVSDSVFFSYLSSNYIRAVDGEKVYAVWPDGTKHWLDMTPATWDASGRDWGAIFIVNDAEVAFYPQGPDITR